MSTDDRLDDGYRLWLRYEQVADPDRLAEYRACFAEIVLPPLTRTLQVAARELVLGLSGVLGRTIPISDDVTRAGAVLAGTSQSSRRIASLGLDGRLASLGAEGFIVRRVTIEGVACTVIAASRDIGVLYGVFYLLRRLQTGAAPDEVGTESGPKLAYRMLDHWDNLDGTVERGYAGGSLWEWDKLPADVSPRYEDYARSNASIGINGTVLTNVNANALVLTEPYLRKVAALADVMRPYGVRVYLSARFSAPIEMGGLATADPLDGGVVRFWAERAGEIYRYIPDFGGFLVKANSEGQPGPQDYGRTHADGANLLADALAPHGGIVIWRAFVYRTDERDDRAKQAYRELVPLDGLFRDNVLVQVKNGPIDFQPREPFHPLFGAMPKTPLVLELQITQEYLGFATHLVYLATLFRETLESDTFADGPGSTVARGLCRGPRSGMAGVANIGTDRNWCGHPFAQSNWFAFGRLAWDPEASIEQIADDWIRMTFSGDERFVEPVRALMLQSREAVVDYMTPLGLHHLMAWSHHYGPGPWIAEGRTDWTSVYFHRADADGVGFDRSPSGSNAVEQYRTPLRELFANVETCPENLLLWFHHVDWNRPMRSGRTLWDELCHRYYRGVATVASMVSRWDSLEGLIDRGRHQQVRALLRTQLQEAKWWRDACVLYFQTFSGQLIPPGYEAPERTLDEYKAIVHKGVPGI